MPTGSDPLAPHLARWALTPDGDPLVTPSSTLLPVRTPDGRPAILKVTPHEEERTGARVMAWWAGRGAARVLARHGDALLLERVPPGRSLADLARSGPAGDAEATRTLCAAAATLHDPAGRPPPPAGLPDLPTWFRALEPGAAAHGDRLPLLRAAAETARDLLADQRDVVVLHGDLHHGNLLDAGDPATGRRGWLAIDPKGLLGDRAFDYANLFRNPHDPGTDTPGAPAVGSRAASAALATDPDRLARTADLVAELADLDRDRLLRWVLALCGLSACWYLEDGVDPALDLAVAALALAELRRA